ncbi:MAG: hypothetical protein DRP01_05290 [Archaeoglobales archaeon]|nr:MAG: hypothetical protein DRP01_05290 [Archaeoglobales archaeon]
MKIVGVTFPIPKQFMDRFFKEDKNVFVKPATVWKELKPRMKFVFYQSREDQGFVGEAKIKEIKLIDDPMKVFEIYGNRVFLTKEELKDYVKSQERWGRKTEKKKKKWLVIELEDIRKYDKPIKPKRFVPVGGQYIRR